MHGVGGIFGALMTGVFATTSVNSVGANGLFYGNPGLLLVQLVGVLATIIFAAGTTFVLVTVLDKTIGIRTDQEEQHEGLDLAEQGEPAYHELF